MGNGFASVQRYEEIHLVAWSMGVWAASIALKNVKIASATAINGTEMPVDDEFGIPEQIASGTLETLTYETLSRFNRRMCLSAQVLELFNANAPQRNINDLKDELLAIYRQAKEVPQSSVVWNRVVIGCNDRIFPFSNQERFWATKETTKIEVIDAPHYPFYLWNEWREILF